MKIVWVLLIASCELCRRTSLCVEVRQSPSCSCISSLRSLKKSEKHEIQLFYFPSGIYTWIFLDFRKRYIATELCSIHLYTANLIMHKVLKIQAFGNQYATTDIHTLRTSRVLKLWQKFLKKVDKRITNIH